jgi:4-amino-4-deoxy-L-arabinose transferase-like glycosyltransferase
MAAVWTKWRAPLAAMLVMLVLALPGFFSLPPVDRDEARFAQSSAQMLASGDLIDIRLGNEARYKKPVGIYWLQAAVAGLTGQAQSIWAYRLVSLAGAIASVGLTVVISRRVMGEGAAMLAGVLLASCFLLGGEARLAKTDAMQLAAIMAAQTALAYAFLPYGRLRPPQMRFGMAMLFWVALGAGILIKGPIPPLVSLTTLGALCWYRRDLALWRALRPVTGLAVVAVMVLPWLAAITIKSGGAFWQASVGQDMLAKVGHGQESHGAPPGTYLALMWLTLWPGSAVLAAALPTIWRKKRMATVIFTAAWIIPVWLVFELTATKLIHYVLPAYPALAILTAWGFTQAKAGPWARAAGALLAVLVPAAFLAGIWIGTKRLGVDPGAIYWLGGGACVMGALGLAAALWRGTLANQAASGSAVVIVASLGLAVALFPTLARLPMLWPAVALSQAAAQHPGCQPISVGYAEPSALFLTQGRVRFVAPDAMPAELAKPGCLVVAVEAQSGLTLPLEQTGSFSGLNIGNGRKIELTFYLRP